MTPNDAVEKVVRELERRSFAYMVVGSYSSNEYGVGRSTADADFVVEMSAAPMGDLFRALQPEIVFDPQVSFEKVTFTSRYVGQVAGTKFKIELFDLNGRDAFDASRFSRRRPHRFLSGTAMLPTAEDVIVQKLRWFVLDRRFKDLEDAKIVVSVQRDRLDLKYLREWCANVGASDILEQLLAEVDART